MWKPGSGYASDNDREKKKHTTVEAALQHRKSTAMYVFDSLYRKVQL